jgi:cytochrome c oxidase subunit 2
MNPTIQEVDNVFIFIVVVSVFFLLLVTGVMIYFVFRYSEKRHPKSENITGSTTLEILWTVIPLILVLMMFFYGWDAFKNMRTVPPGAMVVKVTGRMWYWGFEYENKKRSDSTLYVPVGNPVKMEIYSADVNHSFYLPQFRIKEDAIPGRMNYLVFNPTEEGTFDIFCAEYCGMNHSYMLGHLVVLSKEKFAEWYNKVDSVKPPPAADSLKTGTMKTDSLKTTGTVKDSTKTTGKDSTKTTGNQKKDSVKTVPPIKK